MSGPCTACKDTYCCNHTVIGKLFAFRQVADAEQEFQEHVDGIKETRHARAQLFVHLGRVEQVTQMTNEESTRDVVTLAVGHEEGVQLADELVFDVLEPVRDVVFGDDHAVEYLHSVLAELVMVTETQVDNVAD